MREEIELLMRRHGIGRFLYEAPGTRLEIDRRPPAATARLPAPFAGRFRPAGLALPARVRAGDIVGFLAVGPLLRPVTAPADGRLSAPLVAPGSLVAYGDALFAFSPAP